MSKYKIQKKKKERKTMNLHHATLKLDFFFWFLWHINLCSLFNAKSIFIQAVLFQTIQFSIDTRFNSQNISISSYSV